MDFPPQDERAAKGGAGNKRLMVVLIIGVICLLAGLAVRQQLFRKVDPSNDDGTALPRPVANAPFITSHQTVVEKMVEVAGLKPDDTVYDLGCGDGRIVITAVAKSGCRGVGIDIDPERIAESIENAKSQGVADRVEFREQDVFTVDLREVDVAMMYLLGGMIAKLEPQFEQMKPGSRIVTHDFWMEQVRPDRVVEVHEDGDARAHSVILYTTPLKRDPTMERGRPPQPTDAAEPDEGAPAS